MSIRIPPKADIETQNAFKDVELRLRDLEAKAGNGKIRGEEFREMQTLKAEVEGLLRDPDHNEELRETTFVGPVNFLGVARFPTQPELGFIDVVPDGIGSSAQKTHNLHGSLAIAPGGLSADSIRCRVLDVPPNAACFKSDSDTGAADFHPIWDTVSFNTNTSMFTVEGANLTQIHINEGGFYRITVDFALAIQAGGSSDVDLYRNGATIDGRCVVRNDNASAQTVSGSISVTVSASDTDYWIVDRSLQTWQTNDVYNRFCIERLN